MASSDDFFAKFKRMFRSETVVIQDHENIEDEENPEDTVDICCGYKFCKTCYPQYVGCLTYEESLKKENYKKEKVIRQMKSKTSNIRDQINSMVKNLQIY